ncbi:hypothetical protein GGR28_000464 [Lewinella aquimaris]|uniref:DUF2490 domain-containing protein n=1 Tax=Neolewinella aquimaris TaxID=1835722 RepID=A0A840E1M9_9BACT|nr:DUF2490 domain-containing protein [Neolewinella aquimaris]MBB4077863.1 hypothetical protein [Neolewinella aquimaris]
MRLILSLLTLLGATNLTAQLQLFSGFSFERELDTKWAYELEVEHRQTINTGRDNRVLLLLAVNRKISDVLSITPGLRLTPRYDPDVKTELRTFADLNYALPLGKGPFTLEGRLRLQHERDIHENATRHRAAIRPRAGLAYEVLPFTELVAEYEARFRLDRNGQFSRHRYTLGVSQKVSTRISIVSFIRLERKVNVTDPSSQPTMAIYLNYLLPNARDREREYRRPFGRSLLW